MQSGRGYNRNVNNNVPEFHKPVVPSKPAHLKPTNAPSSVGRAVGTDRVTPRGWQRQKKFVFDGATDGTDKNRDSEHKFKAEWAPVPRVIPKQKSNVLSGRKSADAGDSILANNGGKSPVMQRYRSRTAGAESEACARINAALNPSMKAMGRDAEDDAHGVGSLKRMWSQKAKDGGELTHQRQEGKPSKDKSPESSSAAQVSESDRSDFTSDKRLSYSSSTSSINSQLSRSASSASNNSFHHASFKKKQTTWHYITTSPTELSPKVEVDERAIDTSQDSAKRTFDISLQTPRPFRSFSIDDDHVVAVPVSIATGKKKFELGDQALSEDQSSHQIRSRLTEEEDSGSDSNAEVHNNLRRTNRRRTKTRFDAHGSAYMVDVDTGQVKYIEEEQQETDGAEGRVGGDIRLRRMEAVSLEGVTVNESSTDNDSTYQHAVVSEEQPPPLLPRETVTRKSRAVVPPPRAVVPPSSATYATGGNNDRKAAATAFHNSRFDSWSRSTEKHEYQDPSPDSTVPPPLLPRGERMTSLVPQDYTPMSGVDSTPLTRDTKVFGSIASLNSPEEFSYEPMEPTVKKQDMFSYSTAVDPAQPKLSVREYHEIDPDPGVSIPSSTANLTVLDPGSVPPPPACEPPSLPPNTKNQNRQPPASPPPLPPMNASDRKGTKKLNYVEVEIGASDPAYKQKRKSQNVKTNYTEVIVGGLANEYGEGKKGKSVKGKLISMFSSSSSSSKHHDGYNSEGDSISDTSRNTEEHTADFAKERNKLKRLSGRLLRKKKQKSRDESSRQSTEVDFSRSQSEVSDTRNAPVGVYGSATNLSSTSSESSRSSTHFTSTSHSGSSGDGQASRPPPEDAGNYVDIDGAPENATNNHPEAGRRQSYEPRLTQLPPKLDQKSRSEIELNSDMQMAKSFLHPQGNIGLHSRSAESTPSHSYHAQRGGKVGGSPLTSASRVQSHLHQNINVRGMQPVPPQHGRPVSEPNIARADQQTRGAHSRPDSSPLDQNAMRTYPSNSSIENRSEYPSLPKVLPLPLGDRTSATYSAANPELLSPNFPTGSPPPPPPSIDPGNEPPAPHRDLKPERFKMRARELSSGSSAVEYSAAQDIPPVGNNANGIRHSANGDPIYDFVADEIVKPVQRARPSSKSKLLESEPLYQVYRSRTLSHASMRVRSQDNARRRYKSTAAAAAPPTQRFSTWQSDLMTDDAGATTLWREVPEVIASGVGRDLTNDEMKLQQAQFEVVTSQASYMRSLNILIDHFMRDWSMESTDILPKTKRKQLFSNIEAVREVEQRFLQDIEQHFWDKLFLTDIAKMAAQYARSDFEVYVRYVQNQVYQDRILTELQRTNDSFSIQLQRLESSPFCNKLPLLSFLLLPMQRVTRLPLLISAIVNQADSANNKEAYTAAKQALAIVNKLVKRCNEGARKMQQTEQLAEIASELTFANKVKTYALVSQSRSLVKKGEMTVTIIQENKKAKVAKLYLFLFTDVLLMAKKKSFLEAGSNIKYEVIDWAKRAMLFVNERALSEGEIFLVLLENCFGKRVELTLTPVSQNELSRWTDALNPMKGEESGDSIYESWDCPQYQCIVPYTAAQPDELTVDVGDVMRVLRKTTDGWLEGERLRDNEVGWFPSENCEEIEDEHVRARNLKNLYKIEPAGTTQD